MRRLIEMINPWVGKAAFVKYIFLGILSGLFTFLFIHMVTHVIGLIMRGELTWISQEYMLVFASIILGIVWVRKTLYSAIITLSQTIFWNLRKHILSLILQADYQALARKRTQVHAAILSDVYALTDASLSIIPFFTASILALACLVYLASLSIVLFLVTIGVAFSGIMVYQWHAKRNNRELTRARAQEEKFVSSFNTILDGFKEIYMEPRKGRDIFQSRIERISEEARGSNTRTFIGLLNNQIVGQILFYLLITSVLLFFSLRLNIDRSDTVSFVFTLIYLLGSIETIMTLFPNLARAAVASDHLMSLKSELEQEHFHNPIAQRSIRKSEFEQIQVDQLEFSYQGTEGAFHIGPIDITINKGDVIFIYGGNGSGKTTFVHALLGLRTPTSGRVFLNDVAVTSDNYPTYRTAFSAVFSDFYLFDELLGVAHPDLEKWDFYLRLFELEGKVTLEGSRFSTRDLSTGQRKRLALIATLLEEKPVLFLDEWAADQDPYFKKKFYTEIIPVLKQEGVTVVAVTHDDKYYHCADRLYKMDYGKLVEEKFDLREINLAL